MECVLSSDQWLGIIVIVFVLLVLLFNSFVISLIFLFFTFVGGDETGLKYVLRQEVPL